MDVVMEYLWSATIAVIFLLVRCLACSVIRLFTIISLSFFSSTVFPTGSCFAQNDAVIPQKGRPNPASSILSQQESLKDLSQTEWKDIAKGLQIMDIELSTGFLPGDIMLLKSSLDYFRPQVVRASSFHRKRGDIEWYSKQTGASACINAHFFDQNGDPLGLVVSRGIEHKRMQLGGTLLTGLFLAYHERLEIVPRDKTHTGIGLEAIQSGPRLVINGKIAEKLDDINESRRSGICLKSPAEYILFISSSPFRGATLKELGEILSSPQIGCREALNFDGGGSTQLFVRGDLPGAKDGFRGVHAMGRDEVPTVLCLFPST